MLLVNAPTALREIAGGLVVQDSNVPALACVYGAEAQVDADIAKTLTSDEAQRSPQHRQATSAVLSH